MRCAGLSDRPAEQQLEVNAMTKETAFTMTSANIKYGPGVTREIGHDMVQLGATRVMVVTDPHLAGSEPVAIVLSSLRAQGVDAVLFDGHPHFQCLETTRQLNTVVAGPA